MGLKNSEVLENLRKQRVEMEQQLESLRSTYLKVLGAIDALSQIEESNAEVEEETEVQEETTEIQELQEEVYGNVFKFPSMNKEEKKFHVALLEKLIDKQRILFTRLSLSDDPEAKQMKDNIIESAKMMGLPDGTDMNVVFSNMTKMLEVMKEQIDKSGPDL